MYVLRIAATHEPIEQQDAPFTSDYVCKRAKEVGQVLEIVEENAKSEQTV